MPCNLKEGIRKLIASTYFFPAQDKLKEMFTKSPNGIQMKDPQKYKALAT